MARPGKYIPGAHSRSHTQTLPSDRHTAGAGYLRLVPNVLYVQMTGLSPCFEIQFKTFDIACRARHGPRLFIGKTRDHLERMHLVTSSIGHIAIPRQLDSAIGVIF